MDSLNTEGRLELEAATKSPMCSLKRGHEYWFCISSRTKISTRIR
jgi:hypothetical protein